MAFHPYPQLIPSVFNLSGFAPPQSLTSASHWPWVDHPASGPEHATHTLVRIRFRYGSPHSWLTTQHATDSQAHSSKGTPPPHKTGAMTDYQHMVSGTLSLPSRGTFSPFPHGTHPLSVTRTYSGSQVVLADSHRIPRAPCYNGHAPTPTPTRFRLRGYHPLRHAIPDASATRPRKRPAPAETGNKHAPQPRRRNPRRVSHDNGLAIIRFRSPLLTEYPLLRVLEMFHFPASPPHPIQFRHE